MMAIVLSILVTIVSLMVAFFLAVANVNFLVENDFVNKALNNAAIHALQYGNLGVRAKQITADHPTATIKGVPLRIQPRAQLNITHTIILNKTGNVDVEVDTTK